MKIKKEDIIIGLLVVIVVLLVLRRVRSNFNASTPPADLLIRPQNIGKDIDITATKWTNVANYKPGDPGDETKAWYELNIKAWSIPGCWGYRKVLQAGGGGAVGYILSAPAATDYTRDCGVIDTVVLSDGALHAVPDALICQLSAADPVQGTDCVWTLGAGSKWIVSSPAAHGGVCPPAPAPVSFVTNEYFAGSTLKLPTTYDARISSGSDDVQVKLSTGWTSVGSAKWRILMNTNDNKWVGVLPDWSTVTSSAITGPWKLATTQGPTADSQFENLIQYPDGLFVCNAHGGATAGGVYTATDMNGPWTRRGTITFRVKKHVSPTGTVTWYGVSNSGSTPQVSTASSLDGPWTPYNLSVGSCGVADVLRLTNGRWIILSGATGCDYSQSATSPQNGLWIGAASGSLSDAFAVDPALGGWGGLYDFGSQHNNVFSLIEGPNANDVTCFGGRYGRHIWKSSNVPGNWTDVDDGSHAYTYVSPTNRFYIRN